MEQGKVEKLRQKIISDAEAEAGKIAAEAEAQAGAVLGEARVEADRIAAESRERAESEAKEHIRRQISLRELEARNALLGEKGKMIEEVFEKALDDLRRKDREGGYSLTRDLLFKAIESGDEEIILSPEDRQGITSSFLASLNDELRKQGKRGEIKLAEDTREIRGGFVLRHGRTEINSSFETLLAMLRDEVETEVANILFGESK
jgi:V/A-type H+-transporting ATPase subunit E